VPPRPPIPADDLYVRLGVPRDASFEAIELAWRGLLRLHHPDIAGPETLDLAKRINVAHDWLSDPGLRRHYDEERGLTGEPHRRAGATGARDGRGGWDGPPIVHRRPARPPTLAERVDAVAERVGRLTRDELDRLALAEPAPIAFLATLRRFATPERQVVLDAGQRATLAALPLRARRNVAIRDAIVGRLAEIVLGDALDELLGESGGARARERLTRGWDAAVGQPRYGPATPTVETLVATLESLPPAGIRALAASGTRERLGPVPWPASVSPDEDEALRVSSELAGSHAARAVATASGGSAPAAARRAAARIAHLLVLRHAYPVPEFERHAAPWLGTLISREVPWRTRVRPRS
jgi:curved DNA-binding protein CbpA